MSITASASRRPVGRRVGLAVAAFLLVLGAACGDASKPPGTAVNVTLDDFTVKVSRASAPAGTVTFVVHNGGPSTHEMLVVRTDLAPADFPLDPKNGLTMVEEGSPLVTTVDEVSSLLIGETEQLTLRDLKPGRYVLLCNLEGHFLSDMHTEFDVH